MKIAFYSTKPYDRIWFEPMAETYGHEIHFIELPFMTDTAPLARGYDAVCIFVNDDANAEAVNLLVDMNVKAILLRSAGFNHVDMKAAAGRIKVLRVPAYSPDAVAEFAMGLLLSCNRMIHKAYGRTREFNMNINGLLGVDLHGKTAGVIGTGKIGQCMIKILEGFSMRVIAYDPYPNKDLPVEYMPLKDLLAEADVISLHCPLTKDTYHIIGEESISQMKKGVYIVNTSRGALIDAGALIDGLLSKKIAGVGLDVYEEEEGIFYEDCSNKIMRDENLARLTTFPNVILTSHMGFFTKEAMHSIAQVTLENASALEKGEELVNEVK